MVTSHSLMKLAPDDESSTAAAATAPVAMGTSLPTRYADCFQSLADAYGTCGIDKVDADREFAACVGGPTALSELPVWWANTLRNQSEPEELEQYVSALDCDAFTTAQRSSCACIETTAVGRRRALPVAAYANGAPPTAVAMRCLQASVGRAVDANVVNRPADLLSVRKRLMSLGFLTVDADPQELEHAIRVFRCASKRQRSLAPKRTLTPRPPTPTCPLNPVPFPRITHQPLPPPPSIATLNHQPLSVTNPNHCPSPPPTPTWLNLTISHTGAPCH